MYKKIFLIAALTLSAGFSFATDDQTQLLRKLINRKVTFPTQLMTEEKTTVEIQLQIMEDGCLELTASNGNQAIVDFIYERISSVRLPYNQNGKNTYVYTFTFQKEK